MAAAKSRSTKSCLCPFVLSPPCWWGGGRRSLHILYTSGSTEQPKGVLQNHRNLLFDALRVTNSLHVCRDDRLALLHSCSSSASLRRIFPALLNGASLHVLNLKVEGVAHLPDWLIQEQVTISNGKRLLRDCTRALTGEDQFPHLRLLTFAGEPVYQRDVELYKRYLSPHCLMLISLATTETGSDRQYFIDKQTEITDTLLPVGYATPGTEILLLDDDGREVGGFTEAVVMTHEDRPGEPRLVAYLLTDGPAAPNAGALRRALAETLPEYMIPSTVPAVPCLPFSRSPRGRTISQRSRATSPGSIRDQSPSSEGCSRG